ncbi:MAG: circadian clock protein KaiA [Leptolyngbyaceae cyanobacterium bins.59]|nr:circadian clock protein KaiA [Leptolyngbyaceae cyanobacterium bins.59]
MRLLLSICTLVDSDALAQGLLKMLGPDRYTVTPFETESEFFSFVEQHKQQIDCLVFRYSSQSTALVRCLLEQAILLPAVVLYQDGELPAEIGTRPDEIEVGQAALTAQNLAQAKPPLFYHAATVEMDIAQLDRLPALVDQAIVQFLKLSIVDAFFHRGLTGVLLEQQHRLAEKLKERLGYLGVYYKRNPTSFLRNLTPEERQTFMEDMREGYHDIILNYFSKEASELNQKIDNFVNLIFLADVPVSQIVEIHMELMDQFSKQLRLEGRSEEILLDYRLTLIDVIAHLCEMYRRSIPRED